MVTYLSGNRIQGVLGSVAQHCQDTGTDEMGFASNYIFANKIGADNSVVGSNTTALKVYLKKYSSPTGTIYAEVYNSAGVLQHEYDSKDISTLPTSITAITFTGGSYAIQAGDKVGIRCGVLGGSGAPVITRNESLTDPDWEREEYNAVSWTTYDTQSMRMCLTASAANEKAALLTNALIGTRYEETDTRKIFRYKQDLVSGTGLKAYYRFTEASSPFLNHAGSVAGNNAISSSSLAVTDDSSNRITYQDSSVSNNIPSVARWASTSASDGAFAEAGVASDWNFLHYNSSNTNNQPKCTVCFWYNTGATLNNTMFFTTTDAGSESGLRGLQFYQSNWSGSGTSWRIIVAKSGGQLYLLEAPAGYIAVDDAWHFYSVTYDGSTMTLKKDLANTQTDAVSGLPASGDAYTLLCFHHGNPSTETYIPPPNNTAELSIWDRVLTDAELIKIYNSGDGFNLIDGAKLWTEKGTA